MYETSPAHGTGRMTRAWMHAWHARTVVRSRRASRVTRRRMVGRARAIVGWCAPMCATARAIARARRWARGGTSTGTVGGRTATREATTTAAAAKTTREREEGGVGMYGLRGLRSAEDFERLARETVERCESMARALKRAPPSAASVRALDDISDEVCRVVDVAEVCRHTHPSRRVVVAAERAYVDLQEYVASLNADVDLYETLRRAREADGASLSEEGVRVALTLQEDFERGGIHLDADARRGFDAVLSRSLELGMEFQRNLVRPDFVRSVDLDAEAVASLPRATRKRFRSREEGKTWTGSVDASNATTLLRHLGDSEARRDVYVAANAGPERNKDVLANLISSRAGVAHALGFETYASFAAAPLLARTPDAVRDFLLSLSSDLRERAGEELKILRKYSTERTFTAADKSHLMAKARGHECEFDPSAISEYFPLEGVISGIGELLARVLGLRIELEDLAPGEGWTEDLKKLVVKTKDGDMRGTVYLDLLPRSGKFNHAAHFVIQCSRMVSERERQHPSVALVCNFPPNTASGQALLSHGEVETLLHELGHAMHSVLSDTEFQHLSGTRAPMDIVEIPSHLFEHFAWDADALKLLGRHHLTKEPIPDGMIATLRKSRDIFKSMETQQQLVFALADLELHNQTSELSSNAIAELAASIQREHSTFGPVPGTNWELRFGHFVGYGATYYSYLYADILAKDMWERYFAGDSLAPGAGEHLRDKLLKYGGSRHPETLVRGVLGRDSLVEVGGGFRPRMGN